MPEDSYISKRLSEWCQRRLDQHVKPEIQALAKRGRVTLAEVLELRCNSWEWEHLVPAMTDEAFEHAVQHAISNCARAPSPCSTYDESIATLLGPELLRRFQNLRVTSERMARALMSDHYMGTIQGEGAGDVVRAHRELSMLLFGSSSGGPKDAS